MGKAISLRNQDHTYVYRLYESDELYNRITDPDETNNIIDLPETAATVAALKEEVLDWLVATTDNIPWDPDPRFPKIEHGQHEKFDPED